VVTPTSGRGSTRRALLSSSSSALAAGTAAALAGCGGGSSRPLVHTIPTSARDADAAILNRLLAFEHRTVAAYTASVPLFSGRVHAAAKQFLDQELSHAGELFRLVKQADGEPDRPRPSYNLGKPRGRKDLLRLLHTLEREGIAGYLSALPSLSPGTVRAAVASILANDAQHLVVLRLALHMEPIPAAFVTGAE
jgi:ferritin-like protein